MTPDPNEIPLDDMSGVDDRPQNRREWSGAMRSLVLPLLIVGTIVGGLWYFERGRGAGDADSGGYGVIALPGALNTTGRSPSSDVGRAAPDFLLQTAVGGELRFSDLRGSPVLVNFWASWCVPCRKEMPEIVRAYDAHKAGGLVVVAIDLQENDEQVREFAAEYGMEFPVVIDRTGQVAQAWRIGGPIEGITSSYFIDRDGVVRSRYYGPMDAETIARELEKILE